MNAVNVALLSFILYLSFFAWLGYRRGVTRELTVLIAALLGWFLIEQKGTALVSIANLSGAGIQFMFAGGFNGSEEQAVQAILSADKLVPAAQQARFLYLAWVMGVVLVYLGTNWLIPSSSSQSNGWAILLGALNALLFAIIVMPGLAALFGWSGDISAGQSKWDLLALLGRGLELLWDGVSAVWAMINPLGPMALVVIMTGILVYAAFRATGKKSKS